MPLSSTTYMSICAYTIVGRKQAKYVHGAKSHVPKWRPCTFGSRDTSGSLESSKHSSRGVWQKKLVELIKNFTEIRLLEDGEATGETSNTRSVVIQNGMYERMYRHHKQHDSQSQKYKAICLISSRGGHTSQSCPSHSQLLEGPMRGERADAHS